MGNVTYAKEWLGFSLKNFNTAKLLYKEDRYPNPNYSLPSREEIGKVLEFTEELFNNVCKLLNISIKDIKY